MSQPKSVTLRLSGPDADKIRRVLDAVGPVSHGEEVARAQSEILRRSGVAREGVERLAAYIQTVIDAG